MTVASFVIFSAACSDSRLRHAPSLPPLAGAETTVVRKIEAAHSALVADPTPAAWVTYARALHAHDIAEAADAYEVAAENVPDAEKFRLLYLAGHSSSKRDPDRAIRLIAQAAAIRDDYAPLHLRLAALYEKALRHDEARRHYARAQAILPSSGALVGLGRLALAAGRTAESITLLEDARAMTPDHAEVHVALARAYSLSGRARDAARATTLAGDVERERSFEDELVSDIAREAVSVSGLESFGAAALRGRQFAQALAAFDHALAIRPDNLGILLLRAQALVGLGRFVEAEPVLDRVLAASPDDANALAFRGGCAMSKNDLAGAITYLRRAIASDPSLADARSNLAHALRATGQSSEARAQLSIFLDARPHRTDARLLLATILAEEGNATEAVMHVEHVLGADKTNVQALALRRQLVNR